MQAHILDKVGESWEGVHFVSRGQEPLDDCTDLWFQVSVCFYQGRDVSPSNGLLQVVRFFGDLHGLTA